MIAIAMNYIVNLQMNQLSHHAAVSKVGRTDFPKVGQEFRTFFLGKFVR